MMMMSDVLEHEDRGGYYGGGMELVFERFQPPGLDIKSV